MKVQCKNCKIDFEVKKPQVGKVVHCSWDCRQATFFSKEQVLSRFMANIFKDELTGCWLWQGGIFKISGYGSFSLHGKKLAHRVSFELFNGPITGGLFVCHKCDVRLCANPSHLFLGDALANMVDMKNKGRSCKGKKHGTVTRPECFPKGEQCKHSKLKEQDVLQIKSLLKDGVTQRSIAKRFNVSQGTIMMIASGKNWKHLNSNSTCRVVKTD